MSQWKDATSYRQGEKYPRAPRSWRIELGLIGVTVVSGHLHYPDNWVVSCHELWGDVRTLRAANADDAKREALEMVISELRRSLSAAINAQECAAEAK